MLKEFQESARERAPLGADSDAIRRKYLNALHELTGRAVIVYASAWLRGGPATSSPVEGGDVPGFMECCHDMPERQLDLIIHSPGGQPTAAEQIINYLRTQFDHIRAIVPLQAKSAATMMALGCDEIVMGLHSELGPTDPQILIPVPEGQRFAPAHAILHDFDRAKKELSDDVTHLAAWTPILRSYAGGLLDFCRQQIDLSRDVVAGWLYRYMLKAVTDDDTRKKQADDIADYFGSDQAYERLRTHARPIRVEELEALDGMRVTRLEKDDALQDGILSVYHATDLTFSGPAVKIIENHKGARYVRIRQIVVEGEQPQLNPPVRPLAVRKGPAQIPPRKKKKKH